MIFNVVLVEPQIPQNTGNIGRLCVGTNTHLHLIEPLGFDISEKAVRRSGLDYWPHLTLSVHKSFEEFQAKQPEESKLWFISKFGKKTIFEAKYNPLDYFVFGRETTGLPDNVKSCARPESLLSIPMFSETHTMFESK